MTVVAAPGALASPPTHAALCIGNSAYVSSPLANAAHDAEDVAALCRTLGFSTERFSTRAWTPCWTPCASS